MSSKLDEIRQKLKALEEKRSPNKPQPKKTSGIGYPFWDIPMESTATLRLLPDGDQNNTFFWVEDQTIKIPFPGIKGGDENKKVTVFVPCVEMWGDPCPIHAEIRPWYKTEDEELKKLASVYWKKRSYYMQGFVRKDPMGEAEPPECPIRRFKFTPQLFNIVKAILLDEQVADEPTDLENGIDFNIKKSQKGGFPDYTQSQYSRVSSPLTQTERDAIEKYGLTKLCDYLPKRPGADEVAAMYDMFQASMAGELYDVEKWGAYYRPYGVQFSKTEKGEKSKTEDLEIVESGNDSISFEEPSVTVTVEETISEPVEPKQSTQDILAMIRNRNK